MRALREIGLGRAWRYGWTTIALAVYRALLVPPLQTWFLRRLGARVGRNSVLLDVRFMNANVRGFRHLRIGDDCFVGSECLLDLAAPLTIEDQVTISARAIVLTHVNVGYPDHPLQRFVPRQFAGVTIRRGSFLGASVTVLSGLTIGPEAVVAAGSVVTTDVAARSLVAGVPAHQVKSLGAQDDEG